MIKKSVFFFKKKLLYFSLEYNIIYNIFKITEALSSPTPESLSLSPSETKPEASQLTEITITENSAQKQWQFPQS